MRYRYNVQVAPPAPFVHVALLCPETGKQMSDLPAQLDSAADRSVLPGVCVNELGLVPLDELPVSGFGGHVLMMPTYRVQLSLRQLPPLMIKALAHPQEPYILLGRDVLNHYRLLLDGPNLVLEIG